MALEMAIRLLPRQRNCLRRDAAGPAAPGPTGRPFRDMPEDGGLGRPTASIPKGGAGFTGQAIRLGDR